MRGSDPIDSKYHKRMEERERELRRMTERKERDIEKRIGADNRIKDRKRKQRSTIEWSRSEAVKRSRSETVKRSRGESVKRSRSDSVKRTSTQKTEPRSVRSKPQETQRVTLRQDQTNQRMESRPVYQEPSRDYRTADNARTIRRVIKTVVILYVIFGLFAGLVPRLVGNLGEFVTDMRDEFASPEPDYEYVTEEVIVEEKIPVRSDSVDFLIKVDVFMENLDQTQSYLAFEFTSDSDPTELEARLNRLLEEHAELQNNVTPPSILDSYWNFYLQEYDQTIMMLTKAINGESIDGDFEQLNLLQYDKFAELVRIWNGEGVEYEISFRSYDYKLVPRTD